MEISPIAGIRAMPVVKVRPVDSDLSAIVDIENSSNAGDDTYSGSGKKAAGGQDDESEELGEEVAEGESGGRAAGGGKIDYFA